MTLTVELHINDVDAKIPALIFTVVLFFWQSTWQMAWQDHSGLSPWVGASKLAWRVGEKSCGVLQTWQAFILFKTTDSSNHAFDWTNLPGSGGGIINSVKWFSRRSTPELWNKTNQENHCFDFDQSAKAELWIRPISRDKTPGANQDFGIHHIIRMARKVTYWYTTLIAFAMTAPELAIWLWKFEEFLSACVERQRLRKLAHSTSKTLSRWWIGKATH